MVVDNAWKPLFLQLGSQMVNFYQSSEMTDISSRIRFLACEQIELSLHGMFPKAEALPFGSSVNSYGKNGSDLDMTVVLDTAAEVHSASKPIFWSCPRMSSCTG